MSLARGKYGIEYNPRQMEEKPSGLGWVVFAVVVVALISLSWTIVVRIRSSEPAEVRDVSEERSRAHPENPSLQPAEKESEPSPQDVMPPLEQRMTSALPKRPAKVRNLLMRLDEAEKTRDIEMAVSTIETIRALPGSPAADLDDALARRLGALNMTRLFVLKSAQWAKEVVIKRGDSASRIAAENGSTLSSLAKLNDGKIDKVVIGKKLFVMNHPRFNLVIRRRSRTADLSLNGKFFKRYDLIGAVTGKEGAYELPARTRNFWLKELGVELKDADRIELEMLMPAGSPVLISEM